MRTFSETTNTVAPQVATSTMHGTVSRRAVRGKRVSCDRLLNLATGWMGETAVVLNVSAEEIHRSGNDLSMETIVELDSANGGGYMATLELFHQLHCLVCSTTVSQVDILLTVLRICCANGRS